MKTILISVALAGLCAAAVAAPVDLAAWTLSEKDSTPVIAADHNFSLVLAGSGPFDETIDKFRMTLTTENVHRGLEDVPPVRPLRAPEPPASVMFMAGLALFSLSGLVRTARRLLAHLRSEKTVAQRRRVRVETRMMA